MTNHLFETLFGAGRPDAIVIDAPGQTLTYADLQSQTARYANALTLCGVSPGDRVAAQVEKSVANVVLYLATIRAGAVFLPLNTAYTPVEMAYFISDAEPTLIVCDPAARAALAKIAGDAHVETLDADGRGSLAALAVAAPDEFATVEREAENLVAICYTSGTTGRSKGAMLTHGNLASNAETLKDIWGFTPDDVLIHALPMYHVHGLFVAINTVITAGGSMILQSKFSVDAVLAAVARATTLMGVPTFYTRLLSDPRLTPAATAGMRLFISGSAPLLAQIHADFEARTGHIILERYGMTETGMNTSNPYDGARLAGTVGLPLPGVSVRVAAHAGEIGMVEINGPNVFAGYWRNREKTAAAFQADGYFITGDLGVFDENGYLSIVGRDNDLIISGGLNVYPKEIEAEIDALPGVIESAVIGLPDPDFGEAVVAVVAALADTTLTPEIILAGLKAKLARFKQPKRVIIVDELPRNAMGKVQKALLRQRYLVSLE